MDMMMLRIAIEKAYYYQQLVNAAIGLTFTSGGGQLGQYYIVETIRRMDDLIDAINTLKELTDTVVDKESPSPGYYVTLCIKTESFTRGVEWHLNAKFKTLESAEEYKLNLSDELDKINTTPPSYKAPDYIEGERIIVITGNSAPNVIYDEYHF